jgi:hypothetical protein
MDEPDNTTAPPDDAPTPETGAATDDGHAQLPDDHPVLKALRAERSNAREAQKTTTALQAQIAELTTRAETAEAALANHELTTARAEVAAEFNLSDALVKRLQGSTREELAADAADLTAALDGGGGFDAGARATVPAHKDPEREHGRFLASLLRGETPTYED